ncbi:MAG: hypothetical protein ABIK28_22160 [Planctomycetota bacterium]
MSAIIRILVSIVMTAGIVAGSHLHAESFELKIKKIKITDKNNDIFPEMALSSLKRLDIEEPRFRSENPQRFKTFVGEGNTCPLVFAVDEKKGTGKGYDFLYADVNVTGNLVEGRRIPGKNSSTGGWFEALDFPCLDIRLPMEEGEKPIDLPLSVRFHMLKGSTVAWLYLTSLCILEGQVQLGESKVKMFVFDADCNGIFGGKAKVVGSKMSGDRIWIGEGAPTPETACAESVPLGKYFCFDGDYYEFVFHRNSRVDIKKAEVPLGKIEVNQAGFLLELVQEDGVVYAESLKSNEIPVPAGQYRVNAASFRKKYKGALWTLEGATNPRSKLFDVKPGERTTIDIGPPLKLVIRADIGRRGSSLMASLGFVIKGSQDEEYTYLRKDGKKVDLPSITIRDSKNRIMDKGRFEYG